MLFNLFNYSEILIRSVSNLVVSCYELLCSHAILRYISCAFPGVADHWWELLLRCYLLLDKYLYLDLFYICVLYIALITNVGKTTTCHGRGMCTDYIPYCCVCQYSILITKARFAWISLIMLHMLQDGRLLYLSLVEIIALDHLEHNLNLHLPLDTCLFSKIVCNFQNQFWRTLSRNFFGWWDSKLVLWAFFGERTYFDRL